MNTVIGDYHLLFKNGDIRTPLSNRAIRTIAEKAGDFNGRGLSIDESFTLAIQSTLIARLNEYEAVRVKELISKRLPTGKSFNGGSHVYFWK